MDISRKPNFSGWTQTIIALTLLIHRVGPADRLEKWGISDRLLMAIE
jgi:hypothetical protein